MKKLSTYLVVMFMIMYWIFRVIVVLMAQLGKEFIVAPLNMNFEIIILFAFLICAILVVKRKVLGAALYLGIYGVYFGADITEKVKILANYEVLTLSQMSSLFFSIIGIIIPIAVLIDLLLDKGRMAHPVDKKTDWFYKNEQFDRKMDERADKNNYRTL